MSLGSKFDRDSCPEIPTVPCSVGDRWKRLALNRQYWKSCSDPRNLRNPLRANYGSTSNQVIYPYEYMDRFERFNEVELPPKERLYSSLNDENITDEESGNQKNVSLLE